jgi:hypothetical protein
LSRISLNKAVSLISGLIETHSHELIEETWYSNDPDNALAPIEVTPEIKKARRSMLLEFILDLKRLQKEIDRASFRVYQTGECLGYSWDNKLENILGEDHAEE